MAVGKLRGLSQRDFERLLFAVAANPEHLHADASRPDAADVRRAAAVLDDFDGLDELFDLMLKKATVEWHSPGRIGDVVDCDCRVSRWGNTSFDVEVAGSVGERPVFTAHLVQVSVVPGEARSTRHASLTGHPDAELPQLPRQTLAGDADRLRRARDVPAVLAQALGDHCQSMVFGLPRVGRSRNKVTMAQFEGEDGCALRRLRGECDQARKKTYTQK